MYMYLSLMSNWGKFNLLHFLASNIFLTKLAEISMPRVKGPLCIVRLCVCVCEHVKRESERERELTLLAGVLYIDMALP